jgi:hypothetical protein
MTPQGLIALCKHPVDGLDGKPYVPEHIYLTVPKKSPPRERIRLAGRSGPLGLVCTLNETPEGFNVVAVFNRQAVITFLETMLK